MHLLWIQKYIAILINLRVQLTNAPRVFLNGKFYNKNLYHFHRKYRKYKNLLKKKFIFSFLIKNL